MATTIMKVPDVGTGIGIEYMRVLSGCILELVVWMGLEAVST